MFNNTRLSLVVGVACAYRDHHACPSRAGEYVASSAPGSRLVGENKFHVVEDDGGSLEAIAKKI